MGEKYSLLKDVLMKIEQFEQQVPNHKGLSHFMQWLQREKSVKDINLSITGARLDAELSALLSRMYRYATSYTKMGLEDSPFVNASDFGFTATVHRHKSITKMNLIREMVYEKSSGMEVIKRLLKDGIIAQYDNPEDGRSKLIRLTKKGESEITKAYRKMSVVSNIVTAKMLIEKKIVLLELLQEMDAFHKGIYEDAPKNLEQIHAIFLNN